MPFQHRAAIRRGVAVCGAGLLLGTIAGCLTPYYERPYEDWRRPDPPAPSQRQFAGDRDACIQKATVPMPLVASRGNVAATEVHEEIFLECMKRLGWILPGESGPPEE